TAGDRSLELDRHRRAHARAVPRPAGRMAVPAHRRTSPRCDPLMLTVRYDWLGLEPGDRVLDLGCGAGRHAFESFRRGARVVAFDYDDAELKDVKAIFGAISDAEGSTLPATSWGGCTNGDARMLPFPDACFDKIIA